MGKQKLNHVFYRKMSIAYWSTIAYRKNRILLFNKNRELTFFYASLISCKRSKATEKLIAYL